MTTDSIINKNSTKEKQAKENLQKQYYKNEHGQKQSTHQTLMTDKDKSFLNYLESEC